MFLKSDKTQPVAGESDDEATNARPDAQTQSVAGEHEDGATSAPPDAQTPGQAVEPIPAESFPVEVVFHFRVPDDGSGNADFLGTIDTWARGGDSDAGPSADAPSQARVTLWQPVVGSEPDLWEIRLSFADHASLGRMMDEQPARLASLQRLPLKGVEALDVANPVLRRVQTWDWPAPTHETGTTPDKS